MIKSPIYSPIEANLTDPDLYSHGDDSPDLRTGR